MTIEDRVRVLIAVPNNNPKHVIYLPTIWVNLKTYAEQAAPELTPRLAWLDPIILKASADKLLAPYEGERIDVLGLSCYSWNMATNMRIAEQVRREHPECLIVAGGPHLDYRNQDLFAAHPYLDAIVLKDGEIPFTAMLAQCVAGRVDLEAIPGLVLPDRAGAAPEGWRATAPPQLPSDFAVSPWLAHRGEVEAMMASLRGRFPRIPIGIAWETDRGCPYACVFCDWGSNTQSKLRSFPVERVQAEADWIARNRIHVVFMTVANFGMVASDEAILDALVDAKQTYGFPRVFIWNNAKNNVERVVRMNEKAFEAGLVDYHILSVQSLDDGVLETMGRTAIGKERLLAVVEKVRRSGIPCVAQLIFGGPGDTLEKFIGSMTGLMELGIHEEYVAYPFDILPNAPANDRAFQRQWGVRTITRMGAVTKRDPDQETADYSTFIVATNSYDEDEFVRMYVHGRLIIALHNCGLTLFVSRFLRRGAGVPFSAFYAAVIGQLFETPGSEWHEVYRRCIDHIAAFVGPDGVERVESLAIEEVPDLGYQVNVEEYFLFKIMVRLEAFYRDLGCVLEDTFGGSDLLDSVLAFQRAMMIDPTYDRRTGRAVFLGHDWPAYFQSETARPAPLGETITVRRTHSGSQFQYALDWAERDPALGSPLAHWTQAMIGKHYQRVERCYFSGVDALSTRERLREAVVAAE